ncbi:MAG TPA: hypothetical protein VKY89_09845, partial [Thermoanaerobaculia bacterium]|nr:hypothetical protein [Thermoanaerobaculia bacterium]
AFCFSTPSEGTSFFDSESTIICTNAFYKKGTTPSGVVSLALKERERYFRDKDLNELDLVDWRPGEKDHG